MPACLPLHEMFAIPANHSCHHVCAIPVSTCADQAKAIDRVLPLKETMGPGDTLLKLIQINPVSLKNRMLDLSNCVFFFFKEKPSKMFSLEKCKTECAWGKPEFILFLRWVLLCDPGCPHTCNPPAWAIWVVMWLQAHTTRCCSWKSLRFLLKSQ